MIFVIIVEFYFQSQCETPLSFSMLDTENGMYTCHETENVERFVKWSDISVFWL